MEQISSLTPHSNMSKKQFYTKKVRSLKLTQKYIDDTKSFSTIELKEFSFLYLILNNLEIFQENIHLIENIKLYTNENKLIFEVILPKLRSGEKFEIKDIEIDPQLVKRIFKFASIKYILNNHKNDKSKIFELLEEFSRDLKNHELEIRIEELESKFSKDLSETTFNEIKKLKKLQNIN